MRIIKTKEFIEYIGHFDNETLCAKLTILADLYAVEHKVGYAKFKIEDEDKLNLVNNKLDYAGDPAMPINVYIDNTLVNGFYTKTNYSITSTGIFGDSGNSEVSWTAPQPNFLGLSTSQNATEPDVGYAVGDTLYFPPILSATTFYFYAVYEQQTAPTSTTQIALGRAFIKQVISADTYYLTWDNSSNILNISVNGNTVSQGYELQDGDIIEVSVPNMLAGSVIVLVNNNSAPSSISDTNIHISVAPAGGGGGSNN